MMEAGRGSRIAKLMGHALADDPGARVLQVAGIARFALIFIQGIVLVKAGVPLAVVGQVEFVFFVANFFSFFWQNGGRNGLLSWVPASDTDIRRRLASVFVAMHFFALFSAIVLVLASLSGLLDRYDFLADTRNVLLLAGYMFFTISTVPQIYNYLLTNRQGRILWYITVAYTLQICSVLIPVISGWGITAMLLVLGGFAVLKWLFVLCDGRWFVTGLPAPREVRVFAIFTLPLVLHALNSGLMDFVDGWIVSWRFDEKLFALYRYGAKEFPVNALLIGGLLTGLIPRYRREGEVDGDSLKKEISRLIRILLPVNCMLLLVSPLLFTLVYSSEFVLSARIFNIYALTLLSRVVVNQVYLYVYQHNWVLAISTGVEITINVALSLLLLKLLGLYGIPLATVISYLLHKLFLVIYIRMRMDASPLVYLPVKWFIGSSIVLLMCFAISELIYF